MPRLLAVEANHGFVLLERPAFGRRSTGGGSRALLEGRSLRGGLAGFGHGFGHLLVFAGKLLKERKERKVIFVRSDAIHFSVYNLKSVTTFLKVCIVSCALVVLVTRIQTTFDIRNFEIRFFT